MTLGITRLYFSTKFGAAVLAAGGTALLLAIAYTLLGRAAESESPGNENWKIYVNSLDPRDREYLEHLNTEIQAEQDEHDRLKRENDEYEQRVQELGKKLDSIAGGRLTGRQLSTRLASTLSQCQACIVTVVPTSAPPGTGFLYKLNDSSIVVLTCLPASTQSQPTLIEFHRDPLSKDRSDVVTLPATLVHGDPASGICVLRATFGDTARQLQPLSSEKIESINDGERAYSVNAVLLPDNNISYDAFDGNISKCDRKIGAYAMLQVAIGVEATMYGAPLISANGQLVGMMAGTAADDERTHFAFASKDLLGPLQFAMAQSGSSPPQASLSPKTTVSVTTKPLQPAPVETPASIKALTHSAPYKIEESILYDAMVAGKTIIPGPDNTLVIWSVIKSRLLAYKSRSNSTMWEYPLQPQSRIVPIRFSNLALIEGADNAGNAAEIELGTGKIERANLKGLHTVPIAFYRIADVYLSAGFPNIVVDPSTGPEMSNGSDRVIGVCGTRIVEMQSNSFVFGEFSERAAHLRQRETMSQQMRQSAQKDAAARQQAVKDYNASQQALLKDRQRVVAPSEATCFNEAQSIFQLGDTSHFLINRTVWDVTPTLIKKLGVLPVQKHSAEKEEWFRAYMQMEIMGTAAIAVSSDGKYAVDHTHLYDLTDFKIVAELPLPVQLAGFLSDNVTMFFSDEARKRIFFVDVNDLIKSGNH